MQVDICWKKIISYKTFQAVINSKLEISVELKLTLVILPQTFCLAQISCNMQWEVTASQSMFKPFCRENKATSLEGHGNLK